MSESGSSAPQWAGTGAEVELLTVLSRMPLTPGRARHATQIIARGVDWEKLLTSAPGWDTEPVTMTNLLQLGSPPVPHERLDAINSVRTTSRAVALSGGLKALQVVSMLADVGIPAIVLKGVAVGIAGYGDPSLRSSGDVDLLVHPDQIREARSQLVSGGYSTDYDETREDAIIAAGHAIELSAPSVKVELHPSLMPKHMRWEIDTNTLWMDSQAIDFAGGEIQVLSPAHNFLFLCAHGAKHKWQSWRWICDIAQVAERLSDDDCRKVVLLAAATNARRILSLAIHIVTEVFGEVRHRFALEDLEQQRLTRPLVEIVLHGIGHSRLRSSGNSIMLQRLDPGLDQLLFWARSRERLIDRVLPVASVLFVPTDKDNWVGPLKWLQRPWRLATRAVRSFARYA